MLFLITASFGFQPASSSSYDIEVESIREGVYIYRSYFDYDGSKVSANGIIAESSDQVVLIDTPWDEQQTTQLLEWVETEINKPVSFAVITHAHMDRIGGISVYKKHGIETVSSHLTRDAAAVNGFDLPGTVFRSDTLLYYDDLSLEAFYPGPGHTGDNIVVYLNDHDILYGGCFIKSASSASLGNLEDADVRNWPSSLQQVKNRYPHPALVIPGHGNRSDGAIENTLQLLADQN